MTPRHPRHTGGFTLLEVMVAMAILAMAMMGVSNLVSSALRNHTRAVRLEVATLLARGKLAALQDGFERTGFKDFDQEDEGTFEDAGHAEVRWRVQVRKPKVELGPERILAMLTGASGAGADAGNTGQLLQQLVDQKAAGQADGGPQSTFPAAAAMAGALQTQLNLVGEQIKKGLREVRLTVSWKDGAKDESFTVVTHLLCFGTGAPP